MKEDRYLLDIVRMELACKSSGRAGLNALLPQDPIAIELAQAHARAIDNWLQRELGALAPKVRAENTHYTIEFSEGPKMQLRFSPPYSRWILMIWRDSIWWPQVPSRAKRCLSLCDWLGQVRQVATGRASLTQPGPQDLH